MTFGEDCKTIAMAPALLKQPLRCDPPTTVTTLSEKALSYWKTSSLARPYFIPRFGRIADLDRVKSYGVVKGVRFKF